MHVSLVMPWIECIPNVSEGQNSKAVLALSEYLHSHTQVKLLHVDQGVSANRSVFTFLVRPELLLEVGLGFFDLAFKHIDMRAQQGAHPRVGAVDVFPTVALGNFPEVELQTLTEALAKQVGQQYNQPIYLYEKSQQQSHRQRLEQIRKGGYEGFADKMGKSGWKPDFGPGAFPPKTGVTVIGVRDILVAINFSLNTNNKQLAQNIAQIIRTSGYKGKPGKFKHLKAIGWEMPEYGCVQVSTNITNYRKTSVYEVFNAIQELAQEAGACIQETELIGLIPKDALEINGNTWQEGVKALKLTEVRNGDMEKRLLDLARF